MGSITGFTIFLDLSPEEVKRTISAEDRVLSRFTRLGRHILPIGSATLRVWGRSGISDCIHTMPDGSVLALIGSPHNDITWRDVQESFLKTDRPEDFVLPWEGRITLLHISPDGRRWQIWNDWMGSITTYYASTSHGRVVSTLEPATVAAADATLAADVFLPGLVALLLNGYFVSDWTLYKSIKTIPPDSLSTWDETGFRAQTLWTVKPTQDRWEAGWDELVDEMHDLAYKAIAGIAKSRPSWILPLSSGLDSRLIAAVMADVGVDVHAYAWGGAENEDVIYSRKIARTLGFSWKHVSLPKDFLTRYTSRWADWFGGAMHFHGMYLMSFLDELNGETSAPAINGYIGDVLTGDGLNDAVAIHSARRYQIGTEWYVHWTPDQLRSVAKFPVNEALEANADNIREQINSFPGAHYQKFLLLPLRNRQRLFISFMSTLMDYWRGVAAPFMDRSYARFCMSLPRAVFDHRRLLGDVFMRYYGKLAVIPGSYAQDPYILTGRYLVKRRAAHLLPSPIRNRLVRGIDSPHIDPNFESIHACGRDSLWPLFGTLGQLKEWLDVEKIEEDFQVVMESEDVRPLRRLQTIQVLAHRLILQQGQ